MPPKVTTTKAHIVNAAVEIVRKDGAAALNARTVAAALGCSTQPIFSNFATMEQLRLAVVERADQLCREYMQREIENARYPAYKATGMAYIRFAIEEKELFKLLFMRERTQDEAAEDFCDPIIIERIFQANHCTYEQARQLYLSMWIHTHGIATMLVTSYFPMNMEEISDQLTLAYTSIRDQIIQKGENA